MTTIYLVRHATPCIDYARCDCVTAQQRLDEYNQTSRIQTNEITPLPSETQHYAIYCSTSSRAKATARQLYPEKSIYFSDDLIEFDLRIPQISWIKLSMKHWFILARLLWLIGLLRHTHSRQQEQHRIQRQLDQILATQQNSVIISHGLVNHWIEKHLRKQTVSHRIVAMKGCFKITTLILKM